MEIFKKVKICIYAASKISKERMFQSWAKAWLSGEDRSDLGTSTLAARRRSIESLVARAAGCWARSVDDTANAYAHERGAEVLVQSAYSLLPTLDTEQLDQDSSKFPDKTENGTTPPDYQGYVTCGKHRILKEDWEAMFRSQKRLCAVCGIHKCKAVKPRVGYGFVIDYNRKSGKIRGLVCNKCKLWLGKTQENLTLLKKTVEYLEKHLDK